MTNSVLVDYAQNRKRYSVLRMLVRFDFLLNLLYIYYCIQLLPESSSLMAYFVIQEIFIIGATIFNVFRFSRNQYFPLFKEMPEDNYWGYVISILFLMRLPFLRSFEAIIENPVNRTIHLVFSVLILGQIFFAFQTRYWAKSSQAYREKRINKLRRKARLSTDEYEKIRPVLIESARKKEKASYLWTFSLFLFSLIIATILSSSATDFVDLLAEKFHILFPNVFPPY